MLFFCLSSCKKLHFDTSKNCNCTQFKYALSLLYEDYLENRTIQINKSNGKPTYKPYAKYLIYCTKIGFSGFKVHGADIHRFTAWYEENCKK